MYLLDVDGLVKTVDSMRGFKSIDYPIFLRAPTDINGPVRLYWIRSGEEIDPETGRLRTQPMVLTEQGVQTIAVPLRYSEAPLGIYGYPGAATFTMTLFNQSDVPTRFQALNNIDYTESTANASLTLWGTFELRAATDASIGVAWVSPTDYVIPVAQAFHKKTYQLRLFRLGCENLGSHIIYQGPDIDWGYAETPWRILPAGSHRVLVLGSRDVSRVFHHKADSATWLSVDVRDGTIKKTGITWKLREGWTWVSPEKRFNPRNSGDCSGTDWIWP